MSLVLITLQERPRPEVIYSCLYALLILDEASPKAEMCRRNVDKLPRAYQWRSSEHTNRVQHKEMTGLKFKPFHHRTLTTRRQQEGV